MVDGVWGRVRDKKSAVFSKTINLHVRIHTNALYSTPPSLKRVVSLSLSLTRPLPLTLFRRSFPSPSKTLEFHPASRLVRRREQRIAPRERFRVIPRENVPDHRSPQHLAPARKTVPDVMTEDLRSLARDVSRRLNLAHARMTSRFSRVRVPRLDLVSIDVAIDDAFVSRARSRAVRTLPDARPRARASAGDGRGAPIESRRIASSRDSSRVRTRRDRATRRDATRRDRRARPTSRRDATRPGERDERRRGETGGEGGTHQH